MCVILLHLAEKGRAGSYGADLKSGLKRKRRPNAYACEQPQLNNTHASPATSPRLLRRRLRFVGKPGVSARAAQAGTRYKVQRYE